MIMSVLPSKGSSSAGQPPRQAGFIPISPLEKRIDEDADWAAQAAEVQEHCGQLVAIRNKKVVAVGGDEQALRKRAAALEQCGEEEFLIWFDFPPEFRDIPPDLDFPV
jgi:hypothetical protein